MKEESHFTDNSGMVVEGREVEGVYRDQLLTLDMQNNPRWHNWGMTSLFEMHEDILMRMVARTHGALSARS